MFLSAHDAAAPRWTPLRINIVDPTVASEAAQWSPPVTSGGLSEWRLVDLGRVYNASVTEVPSHVHEAVRPPELPAHQINTDYYKYHLSNGQWIDPPLSDEAWRRKVGDDGIAWTTEGIPFRSSRNGHNIAVFTQEGCYPTSVELAVNAEGQALYLMISGITYAMQSHVPNVRVVLRYADGVEETRDLVNPFDIGDCWGLYNCFDTAANGFENIAGRYGPSGSAEVADLTQPVSVDNHAHLVRVAMRDGVVLESVRCEACATDVIYGVMGASILDRRDSKE